MCSFKLYTGASKSRGHGAASHPPWIHIRALRDLCLRCIHEFTLLNEVTGWKELILIIPKKINNWQSSPNMAIQLANDLCCIKHCWGVNGKISMWISIRANWTAEKAIILSVSSDAYRHETLPKNHVHVFCETTVAKKNSSFLSQRASEK